MAAEHFNQIIGRALIDPEFQKLLLNNLPEAVRGFDLDPSELDILSSLDESHFRPPKVTFTWGNMPAFKGVVEGINVKYVMFMPDGTPSRATVNLKMKQASKLMNKEGAEPAGAVNKIEAFSIKQKVSEDNIGEERDYEMNPNNPSGDAMNLPEVSDEVLVAFEHGDIDQPIVIGSLWNTSKLPNIGDKQAGLFDGQHHDKHHGGDIDQPVISGNVPNPASSPRDAASGLASGKRQHKPITIKKEWSASTPLLFGAILLLIIVLGWWWMNNNGTFTADPCAPANQTATASAFVAELTATEAAGGNTTGDRSFYVDETGVIRGGDPCPPTGAAPIGDSQPSGGESTGASSTTGGGGQPSGCGCQGTDYVCEGSVRYNVAECGGSGGCECRGPDLACPDGSYGAFNPQCTGSGDACVCVCDQTDPVNPKICLQGHDSCDPTISCLP